MWASGLTASPSHCWGLGARPRRCRSSTMRRLRAVLVILLVVSHTVLAYGLHGKKDGAHTPLGKRQEKTKRREDR